MEVILLEDVKSLGKKNQVVKVNDGYARNFLFPKKLAVEATAVNKNSVEIHNKAEEAKRKAEKAKALNEISQNEKELRKNIQQEIVDVAYMLADKMVNKQMDEKANQAVVDEFLNNDGNFKC